MSIQFSEIHNLIRTYQRVLKLEPLEQPTAQPGSPRRTDHVSISRQAFELNQPSSEPQADPPRQVPGP